MKVTNQPSPNTTVLENIGTERANGLGNQKKISPGQSGRSPEAGGATIEISDNARLMQRAVDVAKNAPDNRADKVASLKKAVQDGTYKVDAQKVADRLVDEHLGTDFGRNNL